MCAKDNETLKLETVLSSRLVKNVIEEAVINWTQTSNTIDAELSSQFESYARAAAIKVMAASLPPPNFTGDWKKVVANQVENALDITIFIQEATPTFLALLQKKKGDSSFKLHGLHEYSLGKIAAYSGSVGYIVSYGLDPELLRVTDAEGDEHMRNQMAEFQKRSPEKVIVVDPTDDTSEDVINEIRLRTDPPDITGLIK